MVDEPPYGGGAGMVLKPEPVFEAVEALREGPGSRVLLLTPQGVSFTHNLATALAGEGHLILLCGRYEGFDDRIRTLVDLEVSIGDYILMGGELPALVVLDAVVRLVPGVLGDASSAVQESFAGGLLDFPQFTRPPEYRGLDVPDVLLSGNHEAIRRWRRKEALRRTLTRRPDLLTAAALSEEDRILLKEVTREVQAETEGPARLGLPRESPR